MQIQELHAYSYFLFTQYGADAVLESSCLRGTLHPLVDNGKAQQMAIGGRTVACQRDDTR